jgi:hypothetical protein
MRIVKTKSIPNVPDERLTDSLAQLCHAFHGAGIVSFDGPRRTMIDNCRKIRPILAEMNKRGIPNPNTQCSICTRRQEATS